MQSADSIASLLDDFRKGLSLAGVQRSAPSSASAPSRSTRWAAAREPLQPARDAPGPSLGLELVLGLELRPSHNVRRARTLSDERAPLVALSGREVVRIDGEIEDLNEAHEAASVAEAEAKASASKPPAATAEAEAPVANAGGVAAAAAAAHGGSSLEDVLEAGPWTMKLDRSAGTVLFVHRATGERRESVPAAGMSPAQAVALRAAVDALGDDGAAHRTLLRCLEHVDYINGLCALAPSDTMDASALSACSFVLHAGLPSNLW
jgi:hypothetical protein